MRLNKIYYKHGLFLPIILLIIGINYFVDPASIFKEAKYEIGIAQIMVSGQNVANISNYDERIVQKYYIQNLKKKKDIIILGSSRSLEINSSFFPGKTFFNSSVSGATIEDFMAIYGLYQSKDLIPKTIILGLEPWLLNKNNNQKRWQSLGDYYDRISERINFKNDDNFPGIFYFRKYIQIISPTYFQASLVKLAKMIKKGKEDYYSTSQEKLLVPIKLSDGSLVYEEKLRNVTPEEVLKSANLYKESKPIYSLGNFYRLDEKMIKRFEAFVNFLKKDNVEVIFFLPPYHPLVYDYMMKTKDYQMVKRAQNYFENFAQKENIRLIGSFNPSTFSKKNEDFYDGMHPKSELLENIFKIYY